MRPTLLAWALFGSLLRVADASPAFPGAEGFGAEVTGGRGGAVVHVTNLRANGPGSLQAALDRRGKRTIVFDVAGVVEGVPILRRGDVTIAGQSSPGGITLRGLMIQGDVVEEADSAPLPREWPSNFIVRHLRLRSPLPDGSDGDGLRLHHARNGILDHLSIGNASDEAVQISFASNITLQNSIIGETVGEHSDLGGVLINYGDPRRGFPLTRLTLHHNLFSRIAGRLPELSRESPANRGSTMELEVSNNLYYDPHFPIWIGLTSQTNCPSGGYASAPLYYQANFVGNYFWQNPQAAHTFGMFTLEGGLAGEQGPLPASTPTRLYLEGNATNLEPQAHDWQLVYGCNDWLQAFRNQELPFSRGAPAYAARQRLPFPKVGYDSASSLKELLPARVGAWPRDPMDSRLVGYLSSGRFPSTPASQNPAGDSLRLPPPRPLLPDADRDGMPDDWERAHGLNPALDDSAGHRLDPVFTNLEVALESRARP